MNLVSLIFAIILGISLAVEYLDDLNCLKCKKSDKFYYVVSLKEDKNIDYEFYEVLSDFKIVRHYSLSKTILLCHIEDIVEHYDYRPEKV